MSDVSSTSSATSTANSTNLAAGQTSLNTSYSTFLTLLTTQLKNQDPTSPLDTNAFTQQLVAMTGVQQQLLTNQLLQQMVTANTGSVSSSVDLIGKTVTAATNASTLASGAATWNYNLPSTAASGTATISDSSGTVVWTGALTSLGKGDNNVTWNGKNQSGSQLADGGTYTLAVSATDSKGAAISPTISIAGTVKSVQSVNGVTNVTIGSTQVPVSEITEVTSS